MQRFKSKNLFVFQLRDLKVDFPGLSRNGPEPNARLKELSILNESPVTVK